MAGRISGWGSMEGTGRDEILRKKFGRKFQLCRGKGFGTKGRYRD